MVLELNSSANGHFSYELLREPFSIEGSIGHPLLMQSMTFDRKWQCRLPYKVIVSFSYLPNQTCIFFAVGGYLWTFTEPLPKKLLPERLVIK